MNRAGTCNQLIYVTTNFRNFEFPLSETMISLCDTTKQTELGGGHLKCLLSYLTVVSICCNASFGRKPNWKMDNFILNVQVVEGSFIGQFVNGKHFGNLRDNFKTQPPVHRWFRLAAASF